MISSIFSWVYWPYIYLLWWGIKIFLLIFKLGYLFSYCWVLRVICIFWVKFFIKHLFYKYFLLFYGLSFDFPARVLLVIELLVDSLFPSIFWSWYLTVLYPPWFLMRNYQVDSAVDRYGSLSSLEFVELLLVILKIILALFLCSSPLGLPLNIYW